METRSEDAGSRKLMSHLISRGRRSVGRDSAEGGSSLGFAHWAEARAELCQEMGICSWFGSLGLIGERKLRGGVRGM